MTNKDLNGIRSAMEKVGIVTTAIAALLALGAIVLAVQSLEDARRYMSIRDM
ncbi:MAG: hypothetical protein JO100_15070 [Pseudonocardia sp.]|jgi:hypothetical protein|nr:hypothetical protein [Pseudonocardia sp.]